MDEERILLGGWLLGYHLKDMGQFEPEDFPYYPEIFKLIKKGKTALEIARENDIHISDLAKMQHEFSQLFYQQIFQSKVRNKILLRITQLGSEGDVKKIREQIDYLMASDKTVTPAKDLALEFINEVESRSRRTPINYGFPKLDKMTGGLHRKELTTIGARPAVGKSSLGLQIALKVARQKQKVLFFPLEMSTLSTVERILCMEGMAKSASLKTGKLTDKEWETLSTGCDLIQKIEKSEMLKIYEGIGDIERIGQAVKQEAPFLIIIDQLTQMRADKNFNSKRDQFSYMTNSLKAMSMQQNIAIILLCQVNRDAQNTEPTMANLKESGSIEEDSDNVILLHKLEKDDMFDPENWAQTVPVLIKLEKQRNGETGDFITSFNPERFSFMEARN